MAALGKDHRAVTVGELAAVAFPDPIAGGAHGYVSTGMTVLDDDSP
ncbi:MAG: hypothetical protein QOK08_2470 [Actinomycetota bacterium]|nr:hypothetical protein [Actinomycetota bacterium]